MPKPATGDGPWGEAIEYWLKEKRIRQADLARDTGIEPKTISSMTRGFHTTTRMLEKVARVLNVPLEAVLVSPDRKSAADERKRMILEVTERVVRAIDTPPPPIKASIDQQLKELGRSTEELERLDALRQKKSRKTGKKK